MAAGAKICLWGILNPSFEIVFFCTFIYFFCVQIYCLSEPLVLDFLLLLKANLTFSDPMRDRHAFKPPLEHSDEADACN